MRILYGIPIAFTVGFCAVTYAQQQPSPQERALSERVLQELNANVQCRSMVFSLQTRIAELEAK